MPWVQCEGVTLNLGCRRVFGQYGAEACLGFVGGGGIPTLLIIAVRFVCSAVLTLDVSANICIVQVGRHIQFINEVSIRFSLVQ